MITRLISSDSVAVTGTITGLLSLAFGWLTVRPNRLASGTALKLWDSLGWDATAIIIGLWVLCLALSLLGRRRWSIIAGGPSRT